jgi:hypothetical protein
MTASTKTTATGLLAKATAELKKGGYKVVSPKGETWASDSGRIFEDAYNIVGVVVFETCGQLLESWPDQQEALVKVISTEVSATEAKAADGYLVLLTPGRAPSERERLKLVRYDMARLRKIVATGDELDEDSDVERVLRPLLPLAAGSGAPSSDSSFSVLPDLLAEQKVPQATTRALIEAFLSEKPLMERLHELRKRT